MLLVYFDVFILQSKSKVNTFVCNGNTFISIEIQAAFTIMWPFCTEQLRATDEKADEKTDDKKDKKENKDKKDDKKDTDVSLIIVVGVCNGPKVTVTVRPVSRPFKVIPVFPIPKVKDTILLSFKTWSLKVTTLRKAWKSMSHNS